MRFIDEAKIKISAGKGGPGCISFRRETFIPRGGPDGGDGGAGGDVIFRASAQLGTLQDFRFKRIYRAQDGVHGSGANKAGRDGEDIVIRVPVGTVVKDTGTGEVLIDFSHDGEEWIACKGGRGGKGNAHFVTSTHQAPKFAQPGEEGTHLEVSLELKLLADVGIIGFPNVGKSTLISRISAAKPKIADYAFTTLTPHLGVVSAGDKSFVVADIPGLVEGAHKGYGLGHRFLKHIERTHVFIHLLDATLLLDTVPEDAASETDAVLAKHGLTIETLFQRYLAIRNELGLFNEKLLHKPEIIVLNKVDALALDSDQVEAVQKALRQRVHSARGTAPIKDEP
ncbi:MAG: GTPase ObgE, partial [Bdellovibrio sp.]|nr:GTPase ObgE [Bdellovibrio sp.]